MRTPTRALLPAALLLTAFAPNAAVAASEQAAQSYIVSLRSGDPGEVSQRHGRAYGASVDYVYRHALRGYAARMSPAAAARLRTNPEVATVEIDRVVSIAGKPGGGGTSTPQTVPTGVARIGGPASSTQAGNGSGMVDVDVAIIDTGVANHPDLNVVGGVNCTRNKGYADQQGHGTHVAGTVAAKDDGFGVVGVAPGARIWSVRVLGVSGSGSISSIICGIDWVAGMSSTIEVANMSLGGPSVASSCIDGSERQAICNAVAKGVTFAVAAGNESADASTSDPAAFPEVITVSSLADFDGKPGGLVASTCHSDVDDTLSDFSNYGPAVDLIAPGSCIRSTSMSGGYTVMSGTSMASPHVAGAAALYLASHPGASPATVRNALVAAGSSDWNGSGDPDGIHEPLLNVAGL